jgi:hypothetical protein
VTDTNSENTVSKRKVLPIFDVEVGLKSGNVFTGKFLQFRCNHREVEWLLPAPDLELNFNFDKILRLDPDQIEYATSNYSGQVIVEENGTATVVDMDRDEAVSEQKKSTTESA